MKEFKDKVLVVTGGSRGIGKAIAVEGAKRGMKIVLNDIDGDQLAKTCRNQRHGRGMHQSARGHLSL